VADRHLLIVDDDDRIRALIVEYLGREGSASRRPATPARRGGCWTGWSSTFWWSM
jgi:CheY-like chemotaxis protein